MAPPGPERADAFIYGWLMTGWRARCVAVVTSTSYLALSGR